MKKLITVFLVLALLLPAAAGADDPDPILGRWVMYWDTVPMNKEYNNGEPLMSFLVLDYNLFIYEDNELYFTQNSIKKDGTFKSEWPEYHGYWLPKDDGTYSLRLLNKTYKAEFDNQGRLLVYMSKTPYPFIRIPSYDYIAENP